MRSSPGATSLVQLIGVSIKTEKKNPRKERNRITSQITVFENHLKISHFESHYERSELWILVI